MSARVRAPILVHITTVPQSFAFLRGQVGYMKSQGFHVEAIASAGEYAGVFASEEGIRTHSINMRREITPFLDLIALWRICRLLRSLKPLIVHAHTPKGGLLGTLAAWIARVPIRIYHIRGMPVTSAVGKRRLLLWCTEWISCAMAQKVLAVSHSIREVAIAEGLCPAHKIQAPLKGSGNGVDAENRFNPDELDPRLRIEARSSWGIPEEAIVIGFVGRLVRDKGVVELAEAWRRLRDEYPTLHLLMVGPLEHQDPIPEDTLALLKADPRVHLTGRNPDAPRFYSAMDMVALPSYREGFPNVPLEASAMRLPVVATRIPGCVDAVVDSVTGILVPPRDEDSLAQALRLYIGNPALRQEHGNAGRQRVLLEFQPLAIWRAVHLEYRELIQSIDTGKTRILADDPSSNVSKISPVGPINQ